MNHRAHSESLCEADGAMPYWRLFYHVIWATRNREPLIAPDWEAALHGYLWGKADALGCIPHAIGGVEDHLHVALSIPPRLSVAQVTGQLKGASSHHVSRELSGAPFAWQKEYGVLSFSERALPKVVAYIHNQKQHHAAGRLWLMLERSA